MQAAPQHFTLRCAVPTPTLACAAPLPTPSQPEQLREEHRRDGFEASSADKIFESTTLAVEQQQRAPQT